jgi:hypothetical protein
VVAAPPAVPDIRSHDILVVDAEETPMRKRLQHPIIGHPSSSTTIRWCLLTAPRPRFRRSRPKNLAALHIRAWHRAHSHVSFPPAGSGLSAPARPL